MFEFIVVSPNHLDCQHGWHGFNRIQIQLVCFNPVDGLNTLKRDFGQNFQNFDFWGAKIFSEFLPLCSLGSACGLGPGATVPEAKHRCIWQPRMATMWLSSGLSRPRRRWMRRMKRAAASDEDFGGKPPEALYVRKRMKCWRFMSSCFQWIGILFWLFVESVPKPLHQCLVLYFVVRTIVSYTSNCFWWVDWHAHHDPKIVIYFSVRSVSTPMWHLHFWRSHSYRSNQFFLSSYATAAMLRLLHEIAGAKSKETE